MSTELLFDICVVAAIILLWLVLPRTAWFRSMYAHWLAFKVVWSLQKMERSFDNYDSPKPRLKRAREAVEVLRAGFWVNCADQKIYLFPNDIADRLQNINKALEADFSYEDIGTTREEVVGFRNGDAHKTSARLLVALSKTPEQSPRDYQITKLAEDASFALEEVGTSKTELESLDREYSRRMYKESVDRFRKYATGASDWHEGPNKFKEQLTRFLSSAPEYYGFSYEDLGTSEEECAKLMQLAWRREAEQKIKHLRCCAERGETNSSFTRKSIAKALGKAGLALSDFGIAESDLDEIERSAYITNARNLLNELRTPGEGWFYSPSLDTGPNIRFYRPALWECVPGDPLVFVRKIEKNLAAAKATLADIGTNESEIKNLVRAGHLESAKFLLKELEHVSQTPRRTQFERVASMLGPKTVIWDDPSNPIDRKTLEEPYPIERDIQAIEYHLKEAGIELEEIGGSQQKLQELRTAIEAR